MLHSLEQLLRSLSPQSVLIRLMLDRPLYEKHFTDGIIKQEIGLDRTGGNPSNEELERLEQDAWIIRHQLEEDPNFQHAIERLNSAGVKHEFGGAG